MKHLLYLEASHAWSQILIAAGRAPHPCVINDEAGSETLSNLLKDTQPGFELGLSGQAT